MFSDLSSRFSTLRGAGIVSRLSRMHRPKAGWSRISWPKIKIAKTRQTCQDIEITDVALSFSGWELRQVSADTDRPKFEGTVYFVWKRKN
jgi:hypothetical protein